MPNARTTLWVADRNIQNKSPKPGQRRHLERMAALLGWVGGLLIHRGPPRRAESTRTCCRLPRTTKVTQLSAPTRHVIGAAKAKACIDEDPGMATQLPKTTRKRNRRKPKVFPSGTHHEHSLAHESGCAVRPTILLTRARR